MTTNLAPILLIVWAIVALVTLMLYAYRGRLTRDEEGQIFLDDAFAHEKAAHHAHTAHGHVTHATHHASEAAKLHLEHHGGHKGVSASQESKKKEVA